MGCIEIIDILVHLYLNETFLTKVTCKIILSLSHHDVA